MKIPAYIALRVVSLTLIAIGLSLASLSIVILASKGNSLVHHSEIMLSLGSLLLLIGLIGPIRVVSHGARIPVEIKRTIAIQAVALPLSGVAFIFAGIIDTSNYVALAYLVVGICAIYSAIAGFYSLSKTLPDTFISAKWLAYSNQQALQVVRNIARQIRPFNAGQLGVKA